MSIVRTLSLRPATCIAATAAAVIGAGTSVIVASGSLPQAPALRPLPVVAAGATVSTPVTGPVGVGATADAGPLVRSTSRTAAATLDAADTTARDTLGTATAAVEHAVETTVPLALETLDTALDTVDTAVDTAVQRVGGPVSGTVTLCPGAVVSTGAQVRVGDLLVLHSVAPTATIAAAGGLVTDVEDGVQVGRQGVSVSTPQVQPDELLAAAGSDAVAATRLVPVRIGVGADWRSATADGGATASTGAGPLSLGTTAATCGPVAWSLLR